MMLVSDGTWHLGTLTADSDNDYALKIGSVGARITFDYVHVQQHNSHHTTFHLYGYGRVVATFDSRQVPSEIAGELGELDDRA